MPSFNFLREIWKQCFLVNVFLITVLLHLAISLSWIFVAIVRAGDEYGLPFVLIHIWLTLFSGSLLLSAELRRSAPLWFGATFSYLLLIGIDWYRIDNHMYLVAYWTLACGLSLLARDRDEVIFTNARLLLAGCFSIAVLRKFCSYHFLSGSFFAQLLLDDPRAFPLSLVVESLQPGIYADYAAGKRILVHAGSLEVAVRLLFTPKILQLAYVVTWWTLAIEVLLALAFFGFFPGYLRQAKYWILATFMLTTYTIIPVAGFSGILLVLGSACAVREEKRIIPAFFLALALTIVCGLIQEFGGGY